MAPAARSDADGVALYPRRSRRWFVISLTAGSIGLLAAACAPQAPAAAPTTAPTPRPAPPTAAAAAPAPAPAPVPTPTTGPGDASAPTAAAAQPGGRPTLRVRTNSDGISLDPAYFFGANDLQFVNNISSALLRFKPGTTDLEPDLATSYEVAPDGLSYTFHLRPGVPWHKGFGTFSGADVKYSFERILDPATKSPNAAQIKNLDHVDTPDPATARFVLKEPDAFFPGKVAALRQGYIVNQKAVQQFGSEYGRNPIGTGPFQFNHWTPKAEVVLDSFDQYYAGPPKVGQVTFKVLPEPATAQAAFEKGEVDIYLSVGETDALARYRADPAHFAVDLYPPLGVFYLAWNPKVPPLDRIEVRQALAHAIDRQQVLDNVVRDFGVLAKSPLPAGLGVPVPPDLPDYPYDPARARQLLQQAGVQNLRFTAQTMGLFPYPAWFLAIQSMWQQVGVTLDIQQMDIAALQGAMGQGNIQVSANVGTARPDPDSLLSNFFVSAAFPPGQNISFYSGIDDLVAAARRDTDQAKRDSLYQQIQTRIMTDLPVFPLMNWGFADVTHTNVQGYKAGAFVDVWLYPVSLTPAP